MFLVWFGDLFRLVSREFFVIGLGLFLGPLEAAVLTCFYCPSASHSGAGLGQDYVSSCLGVLGWPFNHFFTVKEGGGESEQKSGDMVHAGFFWCFWVVMIIVLVHFGPGGMLRWLFSGAWSGTWTHGGVPLGVALGRLQC